ncbi:MAG: hypothetical protein Q7T79_03740 [bacterium]|nr:hypothetical protein [bacterium]
MALLQYCVRGKNREELFRQIKNKKITLELKSKLLKDLKILDIGSGKWGEFVESIQNLGAKAIGIDPQAQNLSGANPNARTYPARRAAGLNPINALRYE